ncbi:hypothetical protein BH24ACT22_BH24ACT22_10400 [soil metagenome]
MHYGRLSKILLLVCFTLFLGLITSCGESDQGSENDNSGNNSGTSQDVGRASKEQGGATSLEPAGGTTGQAEGAPQEIKIALGDIVSVDTEKRRLMLKPVEGERQVFKVMPNATVAIDDSPAELSDLEKGQQAQLRYIVRKDLGRAREVSAFK